MGSWFIQIKGLGAHHNTGYEKDANKLADKFVKELKEAGHTIQSASFILTVQEDNLNVDDSKSTCGPGNPSLN